MLSYLEKLEGRQPVGHPNAGDAAEEPEPAGAGHPEQPQ